MPDDYDAEHPWRTPGSTGPALDAPKPSPSPAPAKPRTDNDLKPKARGLPKREHYKPGMAGDLEYRKALDAYAVKGISDEDDGKGGKGGNRGMEQREALSK